MVKTFHKPYIIELIAKTIIQSIGKKIVTCVLQLHVREMDQHDIITLRLLKLGYNCLV
jgi:hypothetical protein